MAENVNNDKYWVRNISEDGTYSYYNLSEDEIPTFLKNLPNAQGIMRDEKGEMMPYALKNIDKVKSMENVTLHDIDEKNIEAYDQYEQKYIRNYRSNFEKFDNVMDDWGIQAGTPLHTLLAATMAKETGYGYHGVSNKYGARGLMQITGLTFKDLKQRFGDQYQYVCDKYNDGNPISHDDLTKPEFAEASIALGVVVMKDKLSAANRLEGIDIFAEDFDMDKIPWIYAKYYNSGDINGSVEEHDREFRKDMPKFLDTYIRGHKYYKNYNDSLSPKATEDTPNTEEVVEETATPVVDDTKERVNSMFKGVVDEFNNNPDNYTQGGKEKSPFANFGGGSKTFTQLPDAQDAFSTKLEERVEIRDKASEKLQEMMNTDIQPNVLENAKKRLLEDKDYQESFSLYSSPEVSEQFNGIIKSINPNASEEEKQKVIDDKISQAQQEIDNMLAGMSEEERESYQAFLDYQEMTEQQAYNLAYHEEFEKVLPEYESYLNDAMMDYYKPKNDAEYATIMAISSSIIGKLSLATTSEEAKGIFNQVLSEYDASGFADFIAGFGAMLLDMPVFNLGGAIGGAILKGGTTLLKLLGQKVLLTGLTKGANVTSSALKTVSKIADKTGLTKYGRSLLGKAESKAATGFVSANERLAKLRLQQLGSSKAMTVASNMISGSVSGASSFGFHSAVSQYTTHFDAQQMNWEEVRNSAILGGTMGGIFSPFKEAIPSAIQKRFGTKIAGKTAMYPSGKIPKSIAALELGQRTLQGASRMAFIATIEAPMFDLQSRLLEGTSDEWNYFTAMKDHTPMFIALGLPHMFNNAKLVSKTNKTYNRFKPENYYGLSSPFRALGRNYNARMEQSDFENIREYTGYEIYKMSDIRKLNKTQRADLDARMMSKDMPIGTRNRYKMMVGDADTSVSFGLVEGGRVDNIDITKDKNGVYRYTSRDAFGRVIESKHLYGYTTAEAVAFETMSRHTIEMESVRELVDIASSSHIEGANIPQNAQLQNRQADLLRKIKNVDDVPFESFEKLEQRALQVIEKSPNLRTDREIELVDNYTQYLVETSGMLRDVANAAQATAVTINMPRTEIDRVLRLQPEQRTGVDADIYEIYEAYINGTEIPQNETFKRAQTEIDAKVRQLEENKNPALDITPTEEFALLSRMSASQRIQYVNKRFISADGTVEYVMFSDGTDAIRVTEETGNVVYRDSNGRDFTPTEAQLREYEQGGNSYKITSEEAANQILQAQAERLGLLKNSRKDEIEDIEGSIEYTKEDGTVAVGKTKSIDANGNVTLLDGTIVAPENIKTLDSEFISKKVDDMMKSEHVPAGFVASERPTERSLSTMMSVDFGRFVRTSKLWNPDTNLMAIIEGRIAKAQTTIDKLQEKLQSVVDMELKSGDDFSATKAKIESDIVKQRNNLANYEKVRDQYAIDYPIDKLNYDSAIRMQRAEAEARAKERAEADAEAERKRHEENIRKAKENVAKREQERLEKEQKKFEKEFEKALAQEEKEQKAKIENEKKAKEERLKQEVEYSAAWNKALDAKEAKAAEESRKEEERIQKEVEKELKKIEEQEKRIASLDTDGQYAFLHMLLNPFDGAKNGGLNKRFSPEEFTSRMEQFFPDFSKMDMDMESFKMILDRIMRTSKEINRRRNQLTNHLQSVKPGVSLKAKANKTNIEETLLGAEAHLQSLLGYLESIGMRMAESGHKEYLNVFTVVRDKITDGRPLADSIWELLQPKRSGQPIEVVATKVEAPKETKTVSTEKPKPVQKKANKGNKEEVVEQPTEQESESIKDEKIDVVIEVDSLNIADEFKVEQPTENVVTEETVPVENTATQASATAESATMPTAEPQSAAQPKEAPKTPKAKKAPIKVSIKNNKSKDTNQLEIDFAATTSTSPESTSEPIKPAVDVESKSTQPKVEQEVSMGVGESKSTQFLSKAKGEGLSMSIERARNNSGNLLVSKVVDGKRNSPDGWIEEFTMDVNIEGIADNNNLGENWGVFENAYEIKNAKSFKNGDIVRIEKKPRIIVQMKFDGKGGKEIIFTSELKKGNITIESLRENYANENAQPIINRLKKHGITIKWGNLGDFKNNNQEAFYDPKRNEIVLNRNANLSNESYLKLVLGHEAVHTRMPAKGSKEWNGIIKEMSERFSVDSEQWDAEIAQKQRDYKENGIELTREEAIGEILVDWLGKELFTDAGDATPIRETYNNLKVKEAELLKKLQSKNIDKDYVREELRDVRSTISLIEDLATTYNRQFTEKPKGVLGKFWESITSILTAKKASHKGVDFKNDFSANNVMNRAMRALQKAHGGDVQINPKDQYAYIWRNQEKDLYFKEYIESHPEQFKSFEGKPYDKMVGANGKINKDVLLDIQNRIAEKTLEEYRTNLTNEYREQKGLKDKERIQFNKTDYNKPGTPASILQAEILFMASTGDNFVLRTLKNTLGTENINRWLGEFKRALPKSYERLSKQYGIDLATTDAIAPEPTKGKKASTKKNNTKDIDNNIDVIDNEPDVVVKDDWYKRQKEEAKEFEVKEVKQKDIEKAVKKSKDSNRLNEYNAKLFELEQEKPKQPTVQQFKKKYGGEYKFLSPDKKSAWVKEFSQLNKEYDAKLKEWENKRFELNKEYEDVANADDAILNDGGYDVQDGYELRINPRKMSGVEVDNYWRTVINNMALEAKSRQEFFDDAYNQIMQHISNHPMNQLVRTRSDIKDILRIIKNISNQKDMSLAARDKALQEAAKALDTISSDVALENNLSLTINAILETDTRIKSGLNKSEKYASSEKLSFINAAKEGLREPKNITEKITKTEDNIQALNEKLNNGDFANGETFDSVESNLRDNLMRLSGLHIADNLSSMRSNKRTDLKRLNEEFKKAKAELKVEREKANPDTAKIKDLQNIIENYADNRLNILNNYRRSVVTMAKQFDFVETSSRQDLKDLREKQKQEIEEISKRSIKDMPGVDVTNMPVNSAEYKDMLKKHDFGRRIADAAQKTWGGWDFMLSKMTVQREGYDGYLKDKASQWHHDALTTTNDLNKQSLSLIDDAIKNSFGAKANTRKVFKEGGELLKDASGNNIKLFKWKADEFGVNHNTGFTLPTENKNAYWSIGEAVDLVLTSKQAQGRKAIEKSGIRMEDVDAIERILTNNPEYAKHLNLGLELRDGVVKFLGNKAQETHQELYGLKFIEEENYFPLSIAQTRASKGNVIKKSNFIGQSITPGYMISRSRVTSEYNPQNALDKVIQYTTEMSHWIGFSPEAQKINRLLSNEAFAKNVKANFGARFYDRLKEVANIEVGTFSPQLSKNELFNELFAFTKVSKVSFRPITALKQLTSSFTYMGYSADPSYHKDLVKYYTFATKTAGWENIKWCLDNMPRFKARFESGVAGDIFLGDLQSAHANWLKNARNKGYKLGLWMNAYVDAVTIAGGSRAVYDFNMRKFTKMGMSNDAARELSIRLAEQEFNLTQASNESSYLSYAQASADSNVIYKTMLAFTTPIFSLGRRQIQGLHDIYRFAKGGKEFRMKREEAYMQKYLDLGIDPTQARIAASKDMKTDVFKNLLSLGGLALANITFSGTSYATKAWAAYRNNNEEEFEDALKGLAIDAGYRAILQSIPDLPAMGTIIETLKTSIIEGKNWGTALETAFGKDLVGIPASAIADIWRFSTNLFSDEDRERLDALSTLIQVPLLVIFGVDPKTINNYIKAAGAAIDGEFDKMAAYALQLSPSQLKLFEDVNNSSMAKQNFKAKFGMTREEFEKRKANRGISEQRKQEIRKRMNDMRNRN